MGCEHELVEDLLFLFVYGSLKLGECNDQMVKPWVLSSCLARTQGFMHLRPDRYPALFLPQCGVLGSMDYRRDLKLANAPRCESGEIVMGQLLELRAGVENLIRLDEFEGYFPEHQSEYLRVAISVETARGWVPCWTYTGVEAPPSEWPLISEWPPEGVNLEPDPYCHGL